MGDERPGGAGPVFETPHPNVVALLFLYVLAIVQKTILVAYQPHGPTPWSSQTWCTYASLKRPAMIAACMDRTHALQRPSMHDPVSHDYTYTDRGTGSLPLQCHEQARTQQVVTGLQHICTVAARRQRNKPIQHLG